MKLTLRAKIFIILFFLFVGGIITVFSLPESESEIKFNKKLSDFYYQEISGIIEYGDLISHCDYFKLINGDEYYFRWNTEPYQYLPNDGEFDRDKDIRSYAEKGDSVIKEANTNFFTLKKKNSETFRYYFFVYSE